MTAKAMSDQSASGDGHLPDADSQMHESSPSVDTDGHRFGLGARSSSPAKRTRDERDAEDQCGQNPPDTPPAKPHVTEHFSPLPNRSKGQGMNGANGANGVNDGTEMGFNNTHESGQSFAGSNLSFDEQYQSITDIARTHVSSEGDMGYVLPASWFLRVVSRTTAGLHEGHDKALREGSVGPIDNRCLLPDPLLSNVADLEDNLGRPFVPLKPGLQRPDDFEVIPKPAWDLLDEWYGSADGSPTICRYMHNTNPSASGPENFVYELYPPMVQIQRVSSTDRGRSADAQRQPAGCLVTSRSEPYQAFLKRAKNAANIPMENKVRVWKVIETLVAEVPTKDNSSIRDSSMAVSLSGSSKPLLLLDFKDLEQLIEGVDRELIDVEDNTANPKYNGRSTTVGTFGFQEVQTIILEEQLKTGSKGSWASDKSRAAVTKNVRDAAKTERMAGPEAPKPKSMIVSDRPKAGTTSILTRGRNKKMRGKGAIGLQNLGNTCYMNSALQCIRAVEELTWYFLGDMYKSELNSDNPLGHSGAIAKAYAGLVAQFYESNNSFSPRNFRATVGRCQPLFSGYGQQDSQEFLSFLIDGLHEDLNRIHKKPYIENPDSDDARVRDSEYIKELGEIYRQNHRKRNDSVAQDLFTGFYKNTMVCPECDKVSVTFDPYAQVTLQLPVENAFRHTLRVAPWNKVPILIDLEIDLNSSIRQVKDYLARKIGASDAQRLVIYEEYSNKIYKIFDDREVLSEASIQSADIIWAVELDRMPTNLVKRKAKSSFYSSYGSDDDVPSMKSSLADCMAVPLVHKRGQHLALWPTFITLTRAEAQSKDAVNRKIVQCVKTMTTCDLMDEQSNDAKHPDDELTRDPDTVMTLGEVCGDRIDVQAHSIESEDDVVNISVSEIRSQAAHRDGLPKHLTEMYNVSIFGGDREIVPTNKPGSYTNTLETIDDRLERIDNHARKMSSDELAKGDDDDDIMGSEDELADDNPNGETNLTDSDDAAPPPILRRPRSSAKQAVQSTTDSSLDNDDRFLVRLGEGLILTWQASAYEGLFEGEDEDDLRGRVTAKDMEKLPDPELIAKRQRQQRRKKDGVSLGECFTESSKSEVLSEDNAWYCNRCKELRRATKTLELWTVPDILIVHLKRFSTQSRLRDKIDILVDFPIDGLDLTGRVGLDEGKSLTYDLFAVDKHFGGLGGGHYTANTKNFTDGTWYDYNDGFVSPCSPQSAVASSAYLLFYRRRTDGPLGPEVLREMIDKQTATSTRSSSESGEDQPGDPSSPTGSSNASHEAAADHQSRQMAHDGPAHGVNGGSSGLAREAKSASHDQLPSYDEGISMDDDHGGDTVMHVGFRGASQFHHSPSWGFDSLSDAHGSRPPASGSDEETLNDADSMMQEHGSDGAGTPPSMTGMSPLQSSPEPAMHELTDEVMVEQVDLGSGANETPVHDIHVSDTNDEHMGA